MRQSVELLVLVRHLGQLLRDDILTQGNLVFLQLVPNIRQVVIENSVDFFFRLSRHHFVKNPIANPLGQPTPISPDEIEALDLFNLFLIRGSKVLDFKCRILLLLQKQQALEDAIDLNLKALVLDVNLSLETLTHEDCVTGQCGASVDHD